MWLCCRKGAAAQADAGFALQDELAARIALVLDGLAV
jgi:hypothetical protein